MMYRSNTYNKVFFTRKEVHTLIKGAQHLGKAQLKTLLYIFNHMHPISRRLNCCARKIAAEVGCVAVTVTSALRTLERLGLLVKEGINGLYTLQLDGE